MLIRRHLTVVLGDGAPLDEIEAMRTRWDPVMAAGVPAHVTVVYPEEVPDEQLLLERVAVEARRTRAFPLDLRGIAADDEHRGVFVVVTDRTGALRALKRRLLAPPFVAVDHLLHVSIVHPRTSDRGPEAFAALESHPVAGSVIVSELCFTETSRDGMAVLQRFELAPPRV